MVLENLDKATYLAKLWVQKFERYELLGDCRAIERAEPKIYLYETKVEIFQTDVRWLYCRPRTIARESPSRFMLSTFCFMAMLVARAKGGQHLHCFTLIQVTMRTNTCFCTQKRIDRAIKSEESAALKH